MHPMYAAGIIQLHMSNHAAGFQNCSRSLDEVDTTRLQHGQHHHHLHHLKPKHKQTDNKSKTSDSGN